MMEDGMSGMNFFAIVIIIAIIVVYIIDKRKRNKDK